MVIRSSFSGIADSNWKTSESIKLPIKSTTDSTAFTHYPTWSKIIFNAIYQTLIDAGYSVKKNEQDYSISLWGFKFYVLTSVSNNLFCPSIAISGSTTAYYYNACGINGKYNYSTNQNYKFTLTVRGNEDMFCLTLSPNCDTTVELPIFWLAKMVYIPTNENGFIFGQYITESTGKIAARIDSDLYTPLNDNYFALAYVKTSDTLYLNKHGVGVGYEKIPLMTTRFECLIKGMIFTNSAIVTIGKYYKLGNEIYYASSYPGYSPSSSPFLFKVDTIPNI